MVVGFLFSEDAKRVVLIKKNRPEWQKGYYNGIGGHVMHGEHFSGAMEREFAEEAGMKVYGWRHFVTLKNKEVEIYFYNAFGDVDKAISCTDEKIIVFDVLNLPMKEVIYNLNWLIPLALDNEITFPIEFELI